MKSIRLACKELKSILQYDPETGIWTWRQAPSRYTRYLVGQQAGSVGRDGTRRIEIHGRYYYAHQLTWFYMTGKWPEQEVDHRNHIPDDNRWENLRESDSHQNSCNRRKQKIIRQAIKVCRGANETPNGRPRFKSMGGPCILEHLSASSLSPGCMIWWH
jgi:hypothetical protein